MAIGDNYITTQELADYMGIQGSGYDTRIAAVCSAVSREVEDYCHRQFNQAASATARIYRPKDRYTAIVDDFFTTSGLIIQTDEDDDGVFETTWTAPADYGLAPLNGVRNGRTGFPYWQIDAVGFARRFHPTNHPNLQVTAQWGWSAVPSEVKESCLMLGADTFQVKDARFGVAGSDQFGNVTRVRDNVVAMNKLRHFTRQKVFVA